MNSRQARAAWNISHLDQASCHYHSSLRAELTTCCEYLRHGRHYYAYSAYYLRAAPGSDTLPRTPPPRFCLDAVQCFTLPYLLSALLLDATPAATTFSLPAHRLLGTRFLLLLPCLPHTPHLGFPSCAFSLVIQATALSTSPSARPARCRYRTINNCFALPSHHLCHHRFSPQSARATQHGNTGLPVLRLALSA